MDTFYVKRRTALFVLDSKRVEQLTNLETQKRFVRGAVVYNNGMFNGHDKASSHLNGN